MATIITYDLVNKHTQVKDEMYNLGYKITFSDGKGTIHLPNTTLYHATKSPATARDELRVVCQKLAATLERCIASSMDDWAAIYGIPL